MQQQINNNAFVVVLIVAALFKVRLLNRSCHACFLFVFILGRPLVRRELYSWTDFFVYIHSYHLLSLLLDYLPI